MTVSCADEAIAKNSSIVINVDIVVIFHNKTNTNATKMWHNQNVPFVYKY